MRRTLYGKLILAFAALLCVISSVYLLLGVATTRLYLQEVNQKLNRGLAASIVAETPLLAQGKVDHQALETLFHDLMAINPSIEVYLLDREGRILAFNAPPGHVKREAVALEPLTAFLEEGSSFPILGDDPRSAEGRKVFSAAPLMEAGERAGFLYVVLGGETYDSVAQMIEESYILRVALVLAAVSLLVGLLTGLLSFKWLTQRLRRLGTAVEDFRRSDFQIPLSRRLAPRGRPRDEIDELGLAVEQMSERIADQIRELRHADASRREMVASVSHDLRTPLTSLQGYLETLLLKDDTLSAEERRHYLDLAVKHGRRLGQLTAELFELAALESRGAELDFEPFSLSELVQDVAQKFKLEAERSSLRLETEIPEHPTFVSGDIALVERVLDNLIENAIKYTPAGGTIQLALTSDRDEIRASVADSGVGIPAEDIPHIFERFYRVEKSRGDGPEGTGLGLAIAQRIAQLHGREIEVESRPGEGTRFTFALPLAPAGGASL